MSAFSLSNKHFSLPPSEEIGKHDVVFVSDLFLEDYVGGAELTSQALIDAAPFKVYKLHSRDVNLETLQAGHQKHWVFGNFSGMNVDLIPTVVANMSYSIVEYDYKFCRYRSMEKHAAAENTQCDCHTSPYGKYISAFFHGAKSIWWMSEKQREIYFKRFPFLRNSNSTVLSSVFDDVFFAKIKLLRESAAKNKNDIHVIIGSPSWIKGTDDAVSYCKSNDIKHEVVWNLPYDAMLEKLANSAGLVFLPKGADTCPRVVIEAKLLGCKLVLNDNVQHKDEIWFNTDDMLDVESYLYMARQRFWNGIRLAMNFKQTLSGYTTTLNCVKSDYPFVESIKSMLGFCDEVVVVDGGSQDGTWEILQNLAKDQPRLVVEKLSRDWSDRRFATFDGLQKAEARARCTKDLCWQQDSDEIVSEEDYGKIRNLVDHFPRDLELVALPIVEYWGCESKVRVDVNLWKWRLSRNNPNITHGIPSHLRKVDENGAIYAAAGTDGCDYIYRDSGHPVPFVNFFSPEFESMRNYALRWDFKALDGYTKLIESVSKELPVIHHYSWFDIARKVRTYRDYWSKHWASLYDVSQEDTAENNMFFDSPWANVTDADIENIALRLKTETGGWIFHSKVDFTKPRPHVSPSLKHPAVMSTWLSKRKMKLSAEDREVLKSELERLLRLKGSDNWTSVRDASNFYPVDREYSFGTRRCYMSKVPGEMYVDFQASRSLTISSGDDVDTFVDRAVRDMSVMAGSDLARVNEIEKFVKPSTFCEIGFRLPRLQQHFEVKFGAVTKGYDVSLLSVVLGKSLGFNVERHDLVKDEEIDLTGFDLVSCYHVLEHVFDPLEVLKKLRRGMNVGCHFHVEVPLESTPNLAVAHVFPFSQGDLGEMLKQSGFEILNVSNVGHAGSGPIERYVAKAAVN
jgi:glycosyltransferase involved in cell wall biosynthesis